MKKLRGCILSLLVIIAFVVWGSGWQAAWAFVQNLAYTVYSLFVMLLPFLDIEQTIICKIVTIVIVQILCGAGFYVSWKTESGIGKIVSGIADVISTILLLIA